MEIKKRLLTGMGLAVILPGLLLIAGCAGEKKPVSSLSNADYAIRRAQDAKANDFAPAELRMAEEKLSQARTAAENEKYKDARELADEARADAEAAEAKSRSETAKKESQEMQESVTTLQRNVSPQPAPAPMAR